MKKITGVITSDIKSISYSPILFRFQLTDFNDNRYNMLIQKHALNFFQQAKMGSMIEVLSVENKRRQFVIRQFEVFNSEIMI